MRHKHVIGLIALALAALVAPAGASAADTATLKCVSVLEGGDIGERYCVDEPDCLVAEYRTTFLGTERYCLVARPGTGTATSTSVDASRCVQNSSGEFGTRYCVSTDGSCVLSEYRWGGVEGSSACLVPRP